MPLYKQRTLNRVEIKRLECIVKSQQKEIYDLGNDKIKMQKEAGDYF
jgi:hypothetical protein